MTGDAAGVSQRTVNDSGDDRGRATRESFEQHLGGHAKARALLAALAALLVVAGLGLPGSGCLNPRPEELPSSDPEVVTPVRETCDDNPLLVGCELPSEDVDDQPMSVPDAIEGPDLDLVDDDAPPSDPAPGAAGASPGDAGTEPPADAGAP